jgi:hypothetical protein
MSTTSRQELSREINMPFTSLKPKEGYGKRRLEPRLRAGRNAANLLTNEEIY